MSKKSYMLKLTILLMIVLISSLTSCKKAKVYPTDELPANVPTLSTYDGVSRWGKFVVIDAVMYVENKETGAKTVYQHFSQTKKRSNLKWNGSIFEIDEIVKDSTTYSFWEPPILPGIGKFVLNGDTTKFYGVQYNNMYSAIVEDPNHNQQNMGGSSRPYSGQVIDKNANIIAIEIGEMEESINGSNCRYWTQLTLKKVEQW